jgi:hypothetical protein
MDGKGGYRAAPVTRRSDTRFSGKLGPSGQSKGTTKGNTGSSVMTEMQANFVHLPRSFYLVHQCNCISHGSPKGLAASMFQTHPQANVYEQRGQGTRFYDRPGSISRHGQVINLFGQWYPGKANHGNDSADKRFEWFKQGLEAIGQDLPQNRELQIAFPERIGCGLAGGDWERYREQLVIWATGYPRWKCFIIKRG